MSKLTLAAVKKRAKKIRCVFLDIDGVMTDCKLYLAADGSELKAVNVKDGLGMKLLMQAGVEVAVISGRPSAAMQKRLESLGLRHIYLATEDKLPAYEAVQKKLGIGDAECAHVGDDTPDLPLFARVGLAVAVADAHPKALAKAHWQTRNVGGNGAIREVADLILAAQGRD
ncbi:MAG: 3-deoxy-D-manno-octulosonate 8-phosphate phosphatase [Nevskiaceae bacterium]|nr:MAG: 3-deoxy-D-manno-octulosonate 8-phosphate phosphatase [Nevskiaceae bacterium]